MLFSVCCCLYTVACMKLCVYCCMCVVVFMLLSVFLVKCVDRFVGEEGSENAANLMRSLMDAEKAGLELIS